MLLLFLAPIVAIHVKINTLPKYNSTKSVFKSKDANGYILKSSYRKTHEYDK